jgi:hypothetical protein
MERLAVAAQGAQSKNRGVASEILFAMGLPPTAVNAIINRLSVTTPVDSEAITSVFSQHRACFTHARQHYASPIFTTYTCRGFVAVPLQRPGTVATVIAPSPDAAMALPPIGSPNAHCRETTKASGEKMASSNCSVTPLSGLIGWHGAAPSPHSDGALSRVGAQVSQP